MKKTKMRKLIILLLFTVPVHAQTPLRVYTVNYPLQYFAERIGGERARVVFPAPADRDPALWTPSRDIVEAYREADLVLVNGAGYAKWLDRFSVAPARTVDTSQAFRERYIRDDDSKGHQKRGADGASAAGTAVTWLDFYQAARQAEAIRAAFTEMRPAYRVEFENRFAKLRQELLQLDLDVQKLLVKQPDKPLFVSQPLYPYFARRYQLHLASLHWDPDRVPESAAWQKLAYAQEAFPAQWMLWPRQPLAETVDRLHRLGINVIILDPCAGPPAQGDFMDVMRANIENLGKAFQ